MAAQKSLFDLVLKIVDGQQQQLDKLSTEIHGGQQPGIKQIALENRANLDALGKTVAQQGETLDEHSDKLAQGAIVDNQVGDIQQSRAKWMDVGRQVVQGVIMLGIGFLVGKALHIT